MQSDDPITTRPILLSLARETHSLCRIVSWSLPTTFDSTPAKAKLWTRLLDLLVSGKQRVHLKKIYWRASFQVDSRQDWYSQKGYVIDHLPVKARFLEKELPPTAHLCKIFLVCPCRIGIILTLTLIGAVIGIPLIAAAWIWALVSSIQLLQNK